MRSWSPRDWRRIWTSACSPSDEEEREDGAILLSSMSGVWRLAREEGGVTVSEVGVSILAVAEVAFEVAFEVAEGEGENSKVSCWRCSLEGEAETEEETGCAEATTDANVVGNDVDVDIEETTGDCKEEEIAGKSLFLSVISSESECEFEFGVRGGDGGGVDIWVYIEAGRL